MAISGYSQTDSTQAQGDTLRVGGMIIIRKKSDHKQDEVRIQERKHYKPARVSTNWWIVDLGFANFTDRTNYGDYAVQTFAPLANKDWFDLRDGKSVNVNLWIFMQRLGIVSNIVNLKYGLGVELNNYRYSRPVRFVSNPSHAILDNSTTYSKNKLAADYVTVPLMLNFNLTPEKKRGFGFSVGMSGGYLYSSRQKTISAADGKKKVHDDFNLRKWKLSYIAEVQLGPVRLYGSLATQSMFENVLDQTPYNVGIRLSNW